MNEKPEIEVGKLPVITKFIYTLGVLPTSYLMSMTYQEQVTWLYNYLQTQVIPAINTDVEAVQELQTLYELLRTYVNDYFDNLDVQEEINNKLNEMVEDGVLEQIIEQYINSTALWCFDTVSDMKNSTNLINDSYARTLGFNSVNDGGSGVYKIRSIEENETANEMDSIAIGLTLIAELNVGNSVNLKQLGAKGNDTDNDRDILYYALNNYSEVFVPSGTYKIGSNVLVTNNTTLIGDNNSILHYTAGSENFCPAEGYHLNIKNVKIISDAGIVYHINREGVVDTRIENNNLKCNSYGILVNATSNNGKNLYINGNTIETNSDAIEINTTSDSEDKFKNIVITNNILSVTGGSGTSSGFPIGVANGKNITISNNVIDNSRREGIHVEGASKEIVITNNVLNDCKRDGMIIYGVTGEIERCIIDGNAIKGNKTEGLGGIYLPTASTGAIRKINLTNNTINNFDIGIRSYRDFNADNTIIENCNVAFSPEIRDVYGKVTLLDTPSLGNFTNFEPSTIEYVDLLTINPIDPETLLTSSNTGKIIKIKHLMYKIELPITSTSDSRKMKFLKLPTYLNATISTIITTGGNNKGNGIAKVSYDSTNGLVSNVITASNNGVFSNPANVVLTDDNFLAVQPYNPNQTSGKMTMYITIDGEIIIKGKYNVE